MFYNQCAYGSSDSKGGKNNVTLPLLWGLTWGPEQWTDCLLCCSLWEGWYSHGKGGGRASMGTAAQKRQSSQFLSHTFLMDWSENWKSGLGADWVPACPSRWNLISHRGVHFVTYQYTCCISLSWQLLQLAVLSHRFCDAIGHLWGALLIVVTYVVVCK